MMSDSKWNVMSSEDDNVKLIWKGDKDKGVVYVRMKIGGDKRRFVFEGSLKFVSIEEDNDVER
jgi:hypothetical protein